MRPVEKKRPGETVDYTNSNDVVETLTVLSEYPKYEEAKSALIGNIGSFCSYDEGYKDEGDLHVEHLIPKGKGGDKFNWDNFLLACNICNSIKGSRIVDFTTIHLPHYNNTFMDFTYDESGRVNVNPKLKGLSKERAENLYNLIHLGRHPKGSDKPTPKDFRWKKRFETWKYAEKQIGYYKVGSITVDDIIDLVKTRGYWSIWFTLSSGLDDVRKALIERIPGTCKTCFDKNNHYEPIPRNPSNIEDNI